MFPSDSQRTEGITFFETQPKFSACWDNCLLALPAEFKFKSPTGGKATFGNFSSLYKNGKSFKKKNISEPNLNEVQYKGIT